jgi:hypothetical protein
VEGNGGRIINGNFPAFDFRDSEKSRKSLVSITGLQAETLTRDFPITKQDC